MRRGVGFASGLAFSTLLSLNALGADRSFPAKSLIIPMDQTYQSVGMQQAYGLLFSLLRQGVPVHWVIASAKVWHGAPCDTAGDLCAWDCAEEGSGQKCTYPTANPDFFAGAKALWGLPGPAATINKHGYRGGPFVVDGAYHDQAMAIVNAWNDKTLWPANPWASRTVFQVVTVHEASAAFTANSKRELLAAPSIAVFSDGNEDIATAYLRASGIKQSNGSEFPAAKCGVNNCGPGTANPDMLTEPSVMGDMGTCDAPNPNHKNGALFTPEGVPAYCQIMSMHWNVNDRDLVECGGGNCPATQDQCKGVPITYHGKEVVAEVRSFLQYPTHFFAECQAVNAYENAVPNPAWPYLDDPGRMGHFLTTTGNPPACPCNPPANEGAFSCVADGCGAGMSCCLPQDVKEKGAGYLIAASPNPFQVLRADVPYMQYDGDFSPEGGSEPAYNLSQYLGTKYKNDQEVTFIAATDGPGKQDVWMSGYMDGTCDVDAPPEPPKAQQGNGPKNVGPEYCGGKVSYLGGHSYAGKAGQRLFLNALFEADCTTASGQPLIKLSLSGELVVAAKSLPVERDYVITYINDGKGPALDSVLHALNAPTGLLVKAAPSGTVTAEGGSWNAGVLSGKIAQPGDPASSGMQQATLQFTQFGDHTLALDVGYRVGVSTLKATTNYTIRVLLDSDGDGAPDESDPFPNDPAKCGDSDMDTCDDCSSGMFNPANDGCGTGAGGAGTGGDATGGNTTGGNTTTQEGGCGCRAAGEEQRGGATAFACLALSAAMMLRRRRA